MVSGIDRLACSLRDRQSMVHDVRPRGVALKATEQAIDRGAETVWLTRGFRMTRMWEFYG
jgi:DNA invertase Pin-like site-specific DNA recombinase